MKENTSDREYFSKLRTRVTSLTTRKLLFVSVYKDIVSRIVQSIHFFFLVSGFFVQWVECSVVLVVGFIINIIRGFPQFEWVAAIGGVLYATGKLSFA